MRASKYYLLIILVSILPIFSIFTTTKIPHTSDGLPHIARIAAYFKELKAGQFPVRWASQFDYGYGTPIFNFFDPLPYMAGVPFAAVGFSLATNLKIGFALSYILAGMFMLAFTSVYFKDEKKALLVTIMYQFAPFRLVDMLVRGSLGSLYSYTMLPLVLYGVVRLVETRKYRFFILTSIACALLAMSHNIIGLVFFGLAVLFVLFLITKPQDKIISLEALFAGLGVAAFFLIPAIVEHKYTYGYLFTKDLFYGNFPPLINFFIPNILNLETFRIAEVPVQIGLFHTIAIILGFIALFSRKTPAKLKKLLLFCLSIFVIALVFMQPVTKVLWEKISVIRQFQYPWRLLSVVVFVTALLGVQYLNLSVFKKKLVFPLLLFFIVVSTIVYWKPYEGYQTLDENYYWNFPESTNYFGEVQTIWVANRPTAFPKQYVEIIAGQGVIDSLKRASTKHTFMVNSDNGVTVLDRTQFFPGWKVLIDNKAAQIEFQDQNYRGLITFKVPSGKHSVRVIFTQSKTEIFSNYISLASIILLILGMIPAKKRNNL